jgi:hypothetical protein
MRNLIAIRRWTIAAALAASAAGCTPILRMLRPKADATDAIETWVRDGLPDYEPGADLSGLHGLRYTDAEGNQRDLYFDYSELCAFGRRTAALVASFRSIAWIGSRSSILLIRGLRPS